MYKTVMLAHGAGGKQTSELIDQVFKAHFSNPDLTADDAAVLSIAGGRLLLLRTVLLFLPMSSRAEISENSAYAEQSTICHAWVQNRFIYPVLL